MKKNKSKNVKAIKIS